MRGQTPAPDTVACTVPPFVLATTAVATNDVVVPGWNVTSAVVLAPGDRLVPAGAPMLNAAAPDPTIVNGGVSETVWLPSFVIVIGSARLLPSATSGNVSVDGERLSAGVIVLARFCGSFGETSWKSAVLSSVSTPLPFAPPGLRSYPRFRFEAALLPSDASGVPSLNAEPALRPT